jgi:hypothetical protein
VVLPSQTAFVQGRYILDGVVTLHQTIHEMHHKKLNRVILKPDFEKAYDKVKWYFHQQTLRMRGFSEEWRALINNFVFREVFLPRSMMKLVDISRQKKNCGKAIPYP